MKANAFTDLKYSRLPHTQLDLLRSVYFLQGDGCKQIWHSIRISALFVNITHGSKPFSISDVHNLSFCIQLYPVCSIVDIVYNSSHQRIGLFQTDRYSHF
jgi:hypothetical protein